MGLSDLVVEHGEYEIRELRTVDELAQVATVAVAAWGGDTEVEGPGLLVASRDEGALLAGAFTSTGALVGYSHDFPTLDRRVRHSHRVGIDPAHRRQGLALALKHYQRAVHLDAGVELLRWTFDPLRLANARLNIGPVGAIARRYLRAYYGEMTGVNAGTVSDRVLAEWHLGREVPRPDVASAPLVLTSPTEVDLSSDAPALEAAIPDDFEGLVRTDPDLANAWRHAGRSVLEHYFARGYALTATTGRGYVLSNVHLEEFAYPQSR